MASRRDIVEHDATLREKLAFLVDGLSSLLAANSGVFATRAAPTKTRNTGQRGVRDATTVMLPADKTRRSAALLNTGTKTLYLGDRDVTPETGCPLPAGATYTDTCAQALYGVCAAGETTTLGYIVETGTQR
jgi:hypothetical protein